MTSDKMKWWNFPKEKWLTIVYITIGIVLFALAIPSMYWLMDKTFTLFVSDPCPHFQHGMKHVCDKTLDEFQAYSQSVGTLFTGLAFAGLIVTIWFQRKDAKEQDDQNKRQLFETEIQNLLTLLHQKKQSIAIYRGSRSPNWSRHLITGEAAFIEIINNFLSIKYNKSNKAEAKRCLDYDIGEIKSWVSTYFYCICRIDEYCEETSTDPQKYIDLLKSNLNRNEKKFLEYSRNQKEYQEDNYIKEGFKLAERHGIIATSTSSNQQSSTD